MTVKTATLARTEDVTPESKKLDKPNYSTPQQATDISSRFADPEQIEPGISDSVTDQPVSKPAEEVQNEQVNITEKERSTY